MDLTKYLLPSHSIELSVTSRDEHNKAYVISFKTVIERGVISNQFRIIAPIYHGKIYNFHTGDHLSVVYSAPEQEGKDLFEIDTIVKDRHFENGISSLTLMINSEPVKVQRRQAFRVNVFNNYDFKFRGIDYQLVSKDISSTGMLALSSVQLPANTTFDIIFDANPKPKDAIDYDYQEDKIFTIKCRVLDSMAQVEIRRYLNRIQFIGLKESQSQLITQYLYSKQSEIIHSNPESSQKISNYFEHESDNLVDIYSKEYRRLQILGLMSTLTLFFALITLMISRPIKKYVLDYFFNFYRPQFWRKDYLLATLILCIIAILIDFVGLGFNIMELRKRNTTLHWPLILTMMIALAMIIFVIVIATINKLTLF
ncbi:MAG: hypothetical protein BGO41_08965 [Clostridiales bacterium 38-18]|nr:MAG: hypothetical protein BGO41_08965 [Clostridiales bacterium 38-18]